MDAIEFMFKKTTAQERARIPNYLKLLQRQKEYLKHLEDTPSFFITEDMLPVTEADMAWDELPKPCQRALREAPAEVEKLYGGKMSFFHEAALESGLEMNQMHVKLLLKMLDSVD